MLQEATPILTSTNTLPTTINEVVLRMEQIIKDCALRDDRAGYFAVLYHRVTCSVRDCIAQKKFEDGARMEQLDVFFANRYIEAYDQWKAGKPTSASWKAAFDCTNENLPLVLQHLLMGKNAHINLDLGIAAALTMKDKPLDDIHNDFNAINAVLGDLIDVVQKCLTKVNPLLNLLQLHRTDSDELLVSFSINLARDGAWKFANDIHGKTGVNYDTCFQTRDQRIAELGGFIAKPKSKFLRFLTQIIRLFEKKKVSDIIKVLGE